MSNLILREVLTKFKFSKPLCLTQKAVKTLCLRPDKFLKYSRAKDSSDVLGKTRLPVVTIVSAVTKKDFLSEDIAAALSQSDI